MLNFSVLKSRIKNNGFILSLMSFFCRNLGRNKKTLRGKNNVIKTSIRGLFLRHCSIYIVGDNNEIVFIGGGVSNIRYSSIVVKGSNNKVVIGHNISGSGMSIILEDDGNFLSLGDGLTFGRNTSIAAIEGTSVHLGDNCMLSANISIRTGDSHSIIDLFGRRTNPSESISIGNHVWIANSVLIFKGAQIGDNSVVAGGAVVTGKSFPDHCILGGNPAIIIKKDIDWKTERIKV